MKTGPASPAGRSSPGRSHPAPPIVTAGLAICLLALTRGAWAPVHAAPSISRPAPAARVFAVHANSLGGEYVFVSRQWDLAQIAKAFNAVIVASVPDGGDVQLVKDAVAAGMRVYIEFDKKREYVSGRDLSGTVNAVVKEVREIPGLITGIRIADRLNEFLDPPTALGYLRATGGVFHAQIPGVQVLVDASDWEVTCGYPGQSSCTAHLADRYRYERDAVLRLFYQSGYVDGFFVADNLEDFDAAVQARAWRKLRAMFPPPFILFSAAAELSFPESVYPHDAVMARTQAAAFERVPLEEGADGVDLWAWHRPWNNTLRTFLNKDGGRNPLWDALVAVATGGGRP